MSGRNENSSEEEYSDSASELEEDFFSSFLNEKELSHKGILSLVVNVWRYCDQCH